jgi:DNA invertase Pin-like site-specific DNA recombinase
MTTDNKPKCVSYARFSPRPLNASCKCGHTWKQEATADEKIFTSCPSCRASVILRNCESCESQLADLRQLAWKRGWDMVSEHSDKALSGSDDCKDRPGLFDAKVACKRGYRLLVRNLDRLFRDMDKAALFRAEMNAKGVKIISLEQPEANGDSTTGKLMAAIYDWMSEIKREEIRARTRAKMLEHQKNGRKMSAQPPFGFEIDPDNPKRLIRNPTEQSYITTIKGLHRQGLNLRQIARWLEQNNVPRRGKSTWTHQLVKSILQREGLWKEKTEKQTR